MVDPLEAVETQATTVGASLGVGAAGAARAGSVGIGVGTAQPGGQKF